MFYELIRNFVENFPFFSDLLLSHIQITIISVVLAIFFGISFGVLISEYKRYSSIILSFVNILYTVPSIALLGFLISITGVGNLTAIIALSIYGLLPIVRSTFVGIENIDPRIIEASEAMGSTKSQILFKMKLPLAFPIIFSAIRNMVTMTIALAGIASFVGAGGLGVAIYRGITTNNKVLILYGSLLIAFLAIVVDLFLGFVEKSIVSRKKSKKLKLVLSALFVVAVLLVSKFSMIYKKDRINIASKPTTESYILAELTRILIEENTDLSVSVKHGIGGGTANIHPAIVNGDFDIYPEYTGTSWQIVLKEKDEYSESKFDLLKKKYEDNYKLTWKSRFGFNDTYSLGVTKELAEKYNLKTYSDLKKYEGDLTFAAEYDFFEREDGFKGLTDKYKLNFKKRIDMDNGLKYEALLDKKVDVITVFTTDGRLSDDRIVVLKDDLNFYPSYMAGLVIRTEILEKHSELKSILDKFDNILDENTMAKMNYEVETNGKKPEEVARKFLLDRKLIGEK